jgi:hypothetical protein
MSADYYPATMCCVDPICVHETVYVYQKHADLEVPATVTTMASTLVSVPGC